MRRKRWLALMMTVTMGVGLLAGCGSDAADSKGQATGNTEGAGGAAEVNFDEEPYEATLMYWVANDARDVDSVEEAFNKLTNGTAEYEGSPSAGYLWYLYTADYNGIIF